MQSTASIGSEGEGMDQQINTMQQDINQLKNRVDQQQSDINDLKLNDKLQDKEIESFKQTLEGIKEDTQWLRRKFVSAFITAAITAIVGGVIAIAVNNIF